jgi:hypothetical protein
LGDFSELGELKKHETKQCVNTDLRKDKLCEKYFKKLMEIEYRLHIEVIMELLSISFNVVIEI